MVEFRFEPGKPGRRIKSVSISLEFGDKKPGESKPENEPEVFAIAPVGRMYLVPTLQEQEAKRSANVQLGGAVPVGGVVATAKATEPVGWEKLVSCNQSIIGSIELKGRNWGKSNCASWTLLENTTTNTGIAATMRMAVLLKRKNEEPFQGVVKIVDYKSKLENTFGRTPKDDPVLFHPGLEPTNKLREYDIENLGAFDLESMSDVTFTTILEGAVKNKSQKGREEVEA